MAAGGLLAIGRAVARGVVLCAVLAAWAILPGEALAQADDVFAARAVPVDATDATAAAARVKALADGQRRALRLVFEKVALGEDLAKLPRPNDRQVDALVQAIEVDKERTSTVRYLAELTVRFKADDIRALLQQAGVRFAETMSRPVVVLPVLQPMTPGAANKPATAGDPVLWDDPNPWRRAWADLPQGQGLVPLIVPIGDIEDAGAVSAAQAAAGDPKALQAIAQRYRAVDVVVAVLAVTVDPRTKANVLQLAMNRYRPGGTLPDAPAAERPADRPIVVPASANLDERLAALVRDQARAIEDQWKRQHLMRFDQEQRLGMSLALDGLGDLVEARKRLAELSGVRRVDVVSMTRKSARLSVVYSGDPDQLQAAAAQRDMALTPEPPDWRLKLTGAGAATKPQ